MSDSPASNSVGGVSDGDARGARRRIADGVASYKVDVVADGGASYKVAVIGGGLAGLAAAVALADEGIGVELFEATARLGGRAGSFADPASGELIDHCQHVSMGCCTNLADFCRRVNIADCFRRDRVLHFIGPDGRHFPLAASRWLPAPLHLAPALWKLGYLSLGEKIGIGRAMGRLMRMSSAAAEEGPTVGQWLRDQRQSQRAIDRFWSVVLVSALSETVDRASLAAARKVFVDGFLASRRGYEIEVPTVALGEMYGRRMIDVLAARGVAVHLSTSVTSLEGDERAVQEVCFADGTRQHYDAVIVAVPWRRVGALLASSLAGALPQLHLLDQIESAPITAVHLWFDRPITTLPHAVLIDRLSQWVFNHGAQNAEPPEHYYQVVVSASRDLAGRDRDEIAAEVHDELASVWPAAGAARLLRHRIVTQPHAVFSVCVGVDRLRPSQTTPIPNLFLAGDWTATGWPATMESAVRSGYLAAQAALASLGRHVSLLKPDLPRAMLARLLIRK
ncbi:MAG: FAD-dependent oxidoreductase [Planctomycetes bacterium]|nr:FAD-dependent oxidoreductase [Planctomycetota bacterium]